MKPITKSISGLREIILDVTDQMTYNTIYSAINASVGTNYTGWMKSCWPNGFPAQPFRLWFVKLAERKNGKFVPVAKDCINTLSSDGNEFIFDDLSDGPFKEESEYPGYSLIYAKEKKGLYSFRGVFISDTEKSTPHHNVFKRVATKVKLIGKPAYAVELLDDFRI